jgi:4-hydroxy-4-methyl-2-oxoglutarate aldolase
MSPDRDLVGRCGSLGVATLADAMNGRGVVSTQIQAQVPLGTAAGPAYTVSLGAGDNLGLHLALAEAPRGSIVVATCPDEPQRGIWGAIMSAAASAAGLAGFATNGFVRDRSRLAELGFPVFAQGVCVRRAAKADRGRRGTAVTLGGQAVSPGDIVCGDADGLVVIPRDNLEDVVSRAEEIEAHERDVLVGLSEGRTTLELLGLDPDQLPAS